MAAVPREVTGAIACLPAEPGAARRALADTPSLKRRRNSGLAAHPLAMRLDVLAGPAAEQGYQSEEGVTEVSTAHSRQSLAAALWPAGCMPGKAATSSAQPTSCSPDPGS